MENTCFRDPAWLQYNPLTSDTVLEYFSFSQFYDRNCNNEVLKMQTQHSTLATTGAFLEKMSGVQYVVHRAEEPYLFIIKKCYRHTPEKTVTLDYYYVMNGTVYQAPTEKEVSRTRQTNILFSMMETLNDLPFQKPAPATVTSGSIDKKKVVTSSRLATLFSQYYTAYQPPEDQA
ncbi:mediator of RNA polymerase II transcription subunit 6 [Nematocida homosporus]|uniref:mediator of RNA polymerase II transcription subunit 6 n=1 Tax=Nematocida homosporus TaxID=1912981 RepID=UPI00221E9E5B|nr:mediator of RNA polymerase II transcription subunit 6 [Nematocida homosporus]KAI5186421.1 mediator of RNA polymerase II transcription subunit 6 [Nematocida homosporus]